MGGIKASLEGRIIASAINPAHPTSDTSQQRRDGLLDAPKKAPARRKPGKKALQAAAEMSQLLDAYVLPPSNTVILDS